MPKFLFKLYADKLEQNNAVAILISKECVPRHQVSNEDLLLRLNVNQGSRNINRITKLEKVSLIVSFIS